MSAAAQPLDERDLREVLQATEPLWHAMRGERIFVTGGTGFFGAWLLESFAYANRELNLHAELVALSRRPDAFRAKMPHLFADGALHLHQGDVRDFTFPDGEFRFVIHAATEASAKQLAEQPAEMLSTIVAGTERTLQFVAHCRAKRLLLTSSGAVYGRQPASITHLPETYVLPAADASNVYAEGKRASEQLCMAAAAQHGFDVAIARCWAFCGPHLPLNSHFAIGNFIRDALRGGPLQIAGDGTPTRSYQYAGDLAVWLWTLLFVAPSGIAYNVGSDDSLSILQIAEAVRDALEPSLMIEVAKPAEPGAAISRYVPAVLRATHDLGLTNRVELAEVIRRTAAWYGWTEAGERSR